MKFTSKDQESLIRLIVRFYDELVVIESAHRLYAGEGDMRPRIDHFHDAIRAHTSGQPQERLSIEWLAYDVAMLYYLQSHPLSSFLPYVSTSTQLVKSGPGMIPSAKTVDRDTKARIAELYQHYGVLFSALLRKAADHDYMDRTEQLNAEVVELIDAINKGKNVEMLKANKQQKDQRIKQVDAAHHQYATSQLALYESAKDMLKKMASSGMNIVGNFVESSLKNNTQGRGR